MVQENLLRRKRKGLGKNVLRGFPSYQVQLHDNLYLRDNMIFQFKAGFHFHRFYYMSETNSGTVKHFKQNAASNKKISLN